MPLNGWFYFDSLTLLFDLFLEARPEILTKMLLVFCEIWRQVKGHFEMTFWCLQIWPLGVTNSLPFGPQYPMKFSYSEKATKIWKTSPSFFELSKYCHKALGDFQIFVAFSDNLNFNLYDAFDFTLHWHKLTINLDKMMQKF